MNSTHIAVCALTYKRPAGVTALLAGLDALVFDGEPSAIEIVIVDNDPDGSGRAACDEAAQRLRWPVKYVIEPKRGIAGARNTALQHAKHADWICFIDDDEVPDPRWLAELLRTQEAFDADVVGGAVVPLLKDPAPKWMIKGRFHAYARHATGREISYAYTGNVLFRSRILEELGLEFDERWALTGGEDRAFFQRIRMAGYKIVWSDEAIVFETIPASRQTARWILQRAFRYGSTHSAIERDLRPGFGTNAKLVATGCYRVCKGVFFLPQTWPFGRHYPVVYLQHICYGAGILAGWLGMGYEEYRKTHGS